jgi:hypothetical protein
VLQHATTVDPGAAPVKTRVPGYTGDLMSVSSRRRALLLLLFPAALTLLVACDPGPRSEARAMGTAGNAAPATAGVPSVDELGGALPESAGPFAGGPLVRAHGFVRRTYGGGDRRIEVTLATHASTDEGYAAWVVQSGSYPAASLDLPEGSGSGFYTCSATSRGERCDLHIQLRAGYHVELMSNGTAARADLDELLRGIPLRTLARR